MKRLLSLVLALCMIISLVPISFAEDAQETGITIKYDLSAAMKAQGMATKSQEKSLSVIDYENTDGFFDCIANGAGASVPDNNWVYYQKSTTANSDHNIVLRRGRTVIFEIHVPQSGNYKMVAHHGIAQGGGDVDVYVQNGAYNADTYKWNGGTLLGRYNCNGANYGYATLGDSPVNKFSETDSTVITDEAATIYLTEGKHVVTFSRVNMDDTANGYRASVGGFSLISGDGSGAVPMALALAPLDGGKAVASALMSDGSVGPLGDIKVTYASLDETVATVDPETGVITDVGNGPVTITATAEIQGRTVTAKGVYNAVTADKLITVKYDVSRALCDLGINTPAKKDEGQALDMTYDLTRGFFKYSEKSSYGGKWSNDTSNYRLYPYSTTPNDPSSFAIYMREGYYMTYEICVPVAGKYTMYVDGGVAEASGEMQVYYMQGEVSDSYNYATDAKLLGAYSFVGKEKKATVTNEVIENNEAVKKPAVFVAPAAGKYTVTFTVTPGKGYRSMLGSFYLVAGDESVIMATRLTSSHGKATLDAYMSDGTYEPLSGVEIKFESLNPEIALIDEATGAVTDVVYGTARIRATCEIDGKEYVAECDYKSFDTNARGVTIDVDLVSVITNEKLVDEKATTTFNQINYDTTNGIFRFFSGTYSVATSGMLDVFRKNFSVRHNRYISFEVLIPEPGIYDMEMWPAMNDHIVPINVYVAKEKVSRNEADFVGSYDSINHDIPYNPNYFNNIVTEPVYVRGIEIHEPGLYVFTFEGDASQFENTGDENWGYRRGSVGNFRLISGTDAALLGGVHGEDVSYIIAYPDENTITYTDPIERGKTQFNIFTKLFDGTVLDSQYSSVTFKSSDEEIATIAPDGTVHAIGDGDFTVSADVALGGKTYSGSVPMNAYDDTGVREAVLDVTTDIYVREKQKASLVAIMNTGNRAVVPAGVPISYTYEPEGIVEIDDSGMMTGLSEGETTVTATAFFKGEQITASENVSVTLHEGKTASSYYTAEKRKIAQENISKYSWAKSIKNTAEKNAERYLENYEKLYDMVPREGIPRSIYASNMADTNYKYCRYCGEDVAGASIGGVAGWIRDPLTRHWKIQCPLCKRLFPSNDFELLYERGLDENGVYDADRARKNNEIAVANGEKDALLNVLYPEVGSSKTINLGEGLRPGETAEGWGVDDGWGYRPKDEKGNHYTTSTGDIEIHAYIPYYMTGLWSTYWTGISNLATAYVYTGEEKYGVAGAILLDRLADLLPEYDMRVQHGKDGSKLHNYASGYVKGALSDPMDLEDVVISADALFPMTDHPQVISFLSEKAKENGARDESGELINDKTSGAKIWDNWKNNILLELFEGAKTNRLNSNFGVVQSVIAAAAVALDEEPEATEMVEWVYAPGKSGSAIVTGGNVLSQLIDEVDRDGMGTESGDNYNVIWYGRLASIADYLSEYEGEQNYNIWEHPKYAIMFSPYKDKILVGNQLAQVGDSGGVGMPGFNGSLTGPIGAFLQLKDNPKTQEIAKEIAEYIYIRTNGDFEGLNYGIYAKDPEAFEKDILAYIDEDMTQKSEMLAGYGFAILRAGGNYESASGNTQLNNMRDAWIYFGAAKSHGHADNLNLGLEAFGLNIAPDNGYPERTGKDPLRMQWHGKTIAHNTVVVNEQSAGKNATQNGKPLHFDDSGAVKVLDVDADFTYKETENYRRTLVMVEASDDVSYTVDFFRVTGGDKHTYSFHSQAENAVALSGLSMTEQKDDSGNWIGSYAYGYDENGNLVEGVNVPYTALDGTTKYFNGPGEDPWSRDLWEYDLCFPAGYTWLSKIRRDKEPSSQFEVEFDVVDYRKTINNTGDIRLRVTQMNSFVPSEVAIAGGPNPRKDQNAVLPETFDYLLVHHKRQEGEEKLDSLYTTVFEPYIDNRYIESIEACPVEGIEESDTSVRAVKVTHTDGKRIDYIVYSEDNSKPLRVDNLFDFQGFIGVYSVNDKGEVLNSYVNDGAYIGQMSIARDAYEGTVVGFDGELNFGDFDNYIDISIPGETVTDELLSDLAGRWIFIENDGAENAAYEILGASLAPGSDNVVRLDTGSVTNIRGYVNTEEPSEGYIYNMSEGDSFRIPVAYHDNSAPKFDSVVNASTSAGSSITVKLNAESPLEGKTITYVGGSLPRGASLNSETGELIWKPTSSQIGENHVSVTACDNDGRETTIHFSITVYGSTTGETGGSGVTTTPPSIPTEPSVPTVPSNPDEPAEPDEPTIPDAPTTDEKFIDLGNHMWAADSINALADDGIIKGTSENTFSPANNITRADFAILLVRAFKLESDNTDNFADVSESDYFAKELAIARNTGVVNGIGDNKYAPRNTITRQDMMVIVYRILTKLGVELEIADVTYEDFADVAEYAREAVKALITSGIVNGKSGKIAPLDYTTRAEVAVLIKRILDYID